MATIFVADDNPHVHSMVEKSLGAEGHEIAGTMVGSEALESIAQSKPDIVLLDSTLGELDAFDTCREVLSLPGMEKLRVVLLAGPLEDNRQFGGPAGRRFERAAETTRSRGPQRIGRKRR